MFSKEDLEILSSIKDRYQLYTVNAHDITLHCNATGHDWQIISNYEHSMCRIRHRHYNNEGYHDQRGGHNNLQEAIDYILRHDTWYNHKKESQIFSMRIQQ